MKWSIVLATLALGSVQLCSAQGYPARPVTVIVPFPAGGGTDALMRAIAPDFAKALGQPVLVENRGGAGGTIGASAVASAAPDGYTLGMATTSTHAIAPSLYRNLKYDALKSFAPIGLIGDSPYVLVTRANLPASNLGELIRYAQANPGKLTYASVGAGTMSHLIGERFKRAAKIDLLHVPYKGAAPAQTDLLGGQVDLLFDNPSTLVQQIRAGKMKAIAQTERNALLTDVPLFSASALQGFDDKLWYGLVAPAGTPKDAQDKLSAALRTALGTRTMQADLLARGVAPVDPSPQFFAATLKREVPSWARVVQQSNTRLN